MKLSKKLLGAIMIGLAVQTIPACKKDKLPDPKAKKEVKKTDTKEAPPESCPACGMG